MTENEAMVLGKSLYENLTSNANNIIPTKEYIEFVGMTIQALEKQSMVNEILHELREYSAIGTIEEFKALKEKAEAKKPILNNPKINEFYVKEAKLCPVCHSYINNYSGDYCRDCGQRIDWSK